MPVDVEPGLLRWGPDSNLLLTKTKTPVPKVMLPTIFPHFLWKYFKIKKFNDVKGGPKKLKAFI